MFSHTVGESLHREGNTRRLLWCGNQMYRVGHQDKGISMCHESLAAASGSNSMCNRLFAGVKNTSLPVRATPNNALRMSRQGNTWRFPPLLFPAVAEPLPQWRSPGKARYAGGG